MWMVLVPGIHAKSYENYEIHSDTVNNEKISCMILGKLGKLITSAAADVINHNGRKIGIQTGILHNDSS